MRTDLCALNAAWDAGRFHATGGVDSVAKDGVLAQPCPDNAPNHRARVDPASHHHSTQLRVAGVDQRVFAEILHVIAELCHADGVIVWLLLDQVCHCTQHQQIRVVRMC